MFKNTSSQKIALFAFDTTTNVGKTGDAANLTFYVTKDFGSTTALTDTSAAEQDATNAKGWYVCDLTQGETNADHLLFTGKSSTANVVVVGIPIYTSAPNINLLSVDSNGRVDVIKINGTSQTAGDVVANVNTLLTRITSTLFTGITSLAEWLGLIAGKQTGNSTARTEIRATGAGSGTYDETTDSQEAIRDRLTTVPTAIENADGLLDRDMSVGTDSGSTTVRTPRQALRHWRNRVYQSGGVQHICKEDDTTDSWTATLTGDASAEPIVEINPAGP